MTLLASALAVSTARTLVVSGMCLVALGSVLGLCWASARRDDRRAAAGRHPSNHCPDEVEDEPSLYEYLRTRPPVVRGLEIHRGSN